jgi:hypothetical protein
MDPELAAMDPELAAMDPELAAMDPELTRSGHEPREAEVAELDDAEL